MEELFKKLVPVKLKSNDRDERFVKLAVTSSINAWCVCVPPYKI